MDSKPKHIPHHGHIMIEWKATGELRAAKEGGDEFGMQLHIGTSHPLNPEVLGKMLIDSLRIVGQDVLKTHILHKDCDVDRMYTRILCAMDDAERDFLHHPDSH